MQTVTSADLESSTLRKKGGLIIYALHDMNSVVCSYLISPWSKRVGRNILISQMPRQPFQGCRLRSNHLKKRKGALISARLQFGMTTFQEEEKIQERFLESL